MKSHLQAFRLILILIFFSLGNLSISQIPPTALIRIQITYGVSLDEAIVYLHPLATDTFDLDTYDAPKIYSSVDGVPNVMTWVPYNGQWVKLGMNGYKSPMSGGCLTIPLGTRATADGNYLLTISEYYGFDSMNIYLSLFDAYTNDTIPFQTLNQQYAFTANNGDSVKGRFTLFICQDYPVGVKAVSNYKRKICENNIWKGLISDDTNPYSSIRNIQILDFTGSSLFEGKLSDWEMSLNNSQFLKGAFILKVVTDSDVCFRKFFVN
ncbi:MAG: hypothetical protein K1X82_12805 [Bacteroidia bacterium]|nr:hypothetical protein [Bacteroidia bacterium]